ncbi:hypothetical protein L1987_62614 [Smallanthus sonchifolius]|uniref:Uncharacterized protein n=1 Tax=Smallanthus sonchifolius TaxID=185202 RepID=A0ACB9CAY8_9ASTR|nr:hypothetical protein L1987_62614 [Smallanthus sonchifolius]
MKDVANQPRSVIPRCFFLSLLLPLSFFIFLSLKSTNKPISPATTMDLKIRPVYTSYDNYIHHQLHKTTNPKLRQIWTTRDWDRKIRVFTHFFSDLKHKKLISNSSKALCVGARVGQEVEALKRVGVSDSIGLDLVPYPPLVIRGDFHHQPFDDETFDFEFSNVFDHALYPEKFVGEIQRTLKVDGVCVLHVALYRRSDKYSANDLYSTEPLIELFNVSDFVYSRKVDGFGLDTEVVFRKRKPIIQRS